MELGRTHQLDTLQSRRLKSRLNRNRIVLPALLLTFTGLAVLCKLTVWLDPTHRYGGSADAEQKMWFLSWPAFALTHHHNPLLSTYLNYPDGFNLLWNTTMPAVAMLLWPVTALWGAVATYNVITTAAIPLSAFFAFLAIRRYVGNRAACAIGGLLYGFSPAMMAQEFGHATVVLAAATVPVALLLFDELFLRQRLRSWMLGTLIGAFAVFQYFSSQEFLVTELIAGAVLAGVLAVMYRDRIAGRLPYAARALGVGAALVVAALAYPVVGIQLTGPDRVQGLVHRADIFSTTPLNFLIPEGSEWLSPSWLSPINSRFSGNGTEANAYVGAPLMALAVFVLIRYRRVSLVRAAGAVSILMAIFSLGPHFTPLRKSFFPLPWYPFSRLPLLGNVQPSRMMFFVFLGLAILLAYALHLLSERRTKVLSSVAVAIIALLPLFPKVPLYSQAITDPGYFSSAAVDEIPDGAVAFTVPFPSQASVEPMNWQRASGMRFKLLGGYFQGPASPGQHTLEHVADIFSSPGRHPTISGAERAAFFEELRANRVGVVIVAPTADQTGAAAFCASVLGAPPLVRDGFDVWIVSDLQP